MTDAIKQAFDFVIAQDVDIPADVWTQAIKARAFKADGDLSSINAAYHDAISEALLSYLEGAPVAGPRNRFKRAMVEAFGNAADLGWTDGGAELPFDGDALEWFNLRTEQELTYINALFLQAKELRNQDDFDAFAWANEHADAYTRTLREIYNTMLLRATPNRMVTFLGDDGAESCADCQKLKGKRHKISWFVSRNYVPPFGRGLECHPGRRCQHYLQDDKGNIITV